ncbi:MAG: hypothetical protein RL367_2201 [Pseudomonadota bacterium]
MIDNFALLVSHGLLLILFVRIFQRPDLDREDGDIDQKHGVKRLRKSGMRRA